MISELLWISHISEFKTPTMGNYDIIVFQIIIWPSLIIDVFKDTINADFQWQKHHEELGDNDKSTLRNSTTTTKVP